MVLIDLSKAFDSLCHSTLCKLQYLGESNKLLLWFESYLKIQTDNSVLCSNLTVRTTRYYTWRSSGLNSRSNAFQPVHEQFTRLVIKLSLIILNLTLMTLRYIFLFASKNIDSCHAKLLRISIMLQSGVVPYHLLINPNKTKIVLFGV